MCWNWSSFFVVLKKQNRNKKTLCVPRVSESWESEWEKKAHKYILNGSFVFFFKLVVCGERERSIRSSKHMYDDYFKIFHSYAELNVDWNKIFITTNLSTQLTRSSLNFPPTHIYGNVSPPLSLSLFDSLICSFILAISI